VAYFWSIIAALALTTGALWVTRDGADADDADAPIDRIEPASWRGPGTEIPTTRPPEREPIPQPEPAPEPAPEPDPEPAPVADPVPDPAPQPTPEPAPVADAAPEPDPVAQTTADTEPEPEPGGDIVIDPAVLARLAQNNNDAADEAPAAPDKGYEIAADGTLVVNDGDARVTVPGSGDPNDPYVVSWDLLRGVQRTYAPREGKRTLPEWLDALDGRRVVIEGNTLVPVVAKQTSELLVMQNPWDGCCIGVPPTPYDAIEVSLDRPVEFGHSATGYGSIRGTFEVDPYEVSGWLMGLFIISDASYTSGAGEALPDL